MLIDDVAILRRIPMFAEVDIAKLKLLGIASRRLTYVPGDILVKQGDDALVLCIVLSGEVEVLRESGGKSIPLTRLGVGAIIGELGVVLDQPYSSTVAATVDTVALEIEKEVFLELLNQLPQLALALVRELARRVVRTSDLYTEALKRH